MSTAACPRCAGTRSVRGQIVGDGGTRRRWRCGTCLASGSVESERVATIHIGCRQRRLRLTRGQSLGEHAAKLGVSVVTLSRIEAGLPV